MIIIDRLVSRIASSYEAMDIVTWLVLHYVIILFAIIVLSKAVMWAHARILLKRQPERRVMHPRKR